MRVFDNYQQLETAMDIPALMAGAFRFAKQFAPAGFKCHQCGEVKAFPLDGCGTGYACDKHDNMICYVCCGENDKEQMRQRGENILYLNVSRNMTSNYGPWFQARLTNWPGTLEINCNAKRGHHNIARYRYDVWFTFEGAQWHGVQYGDNTQVCRVKRLKAKAR